MLRGVEVPADDAVRDLEAECASRKEEPRLQGLLPGVSTELPGGGGSGED